MRPARARSRRASSAAGGARHGAAPNSDAKQAGGRRRLSLTEAAAETGTPLLGVCLGHQTIGQAFGGKIVQAADIVHGKLGSIRHGGAGLFRDLPSPLNATRYHSLIVDRGTLPDVLEVSAELDDGTIMGLSHKTLPVHGVQFHPESIRSEHGHKMLRNFLDLVPVPA